jgi:hypothetical protein
VVTLVLTALLSVGPVAGMFFFADMMTAKTPGASESKPDQPEAL